MEERAGSGSEKNAQYRVVIYRRDGQTITTAKPSFAAALDAVERNQGFPAVQRVFLERRIIGPWTVVRSEPGPVGES